MKHAYSRVALITMVIAALGAGVSARAGTECAHYVVTAPIIGTRSGSRCVNLPPVFDFPFSVEDCQGIPPLGVSECAGVDLHLPLP